MHFFIFSGQSMFYNLNIFVSSAFFKEENIITSIVDLVVTI